MEGGKGTEERRGGKDGEGEEGDVCKNCTLRRGAKIPNYTALGSQLVFAVLQVRHDGFTINMSVLPVIFATFRWLISLLGTRYSNL